MNTNTDDTRVIEDGDFVIRVAAEVQNLIDSGMAWRLEGHVGRTCMDAIDNGDAVLGEEDHTDYWGSHVPSRHQVKSGTKGSVEYAHARQN